MSLTADQPHLREGRKTMRKKSWVGVSPKQQSPRKGESAVRGTSGKVCVCAGGEKGQPGRKAWQGWFQVSRAQLLPPGLCILMSSKKLSCVEAKELVFADTRKVVFWVLLRAHER